MLETAYKLKLDDRQFASGVRNAERAWLRSSRTIKRELREISATFERETLRMEAPSARLQRTIGGVVAKVSPLQAVLAGGLIGGTVIKDFGQFESGLISVGKTADIEGAKLMAFGDDIQALSAQIPVSSTRLLEYAAAAGQLGVKGTDNLLTFSRALAELEAASDVAGAEGGTNIVRILNITNEDITQVETFTNVLVGLGNNSAATESEILKLATRLAQSTAAFQFTSTEILGISAGMRSLGVEAEIGGTAVQKALISMQDAVDEGGESMLALQRITGLTADELLELLRLNPAEAFERFAEGLNRVRASGGDVIKTLDELGITEVRSVTVLSTLAKGYDEFVKSLRLAEEEQENNNARSVEAEKAFKSQESAIQSTGSSLNRAAEELGEFISPVTVSGLNLVADLFNGIAESVEAVNQSLREGQSVGGEGIYSDALPPLALLSKAVKETARVIVDGTTGIIKFAFTPVSSTRSLFTDVKDEVEDTATEVEKFALTTEKNSNKIIGIHSLLKESYRDLDAVVKSQALEQAEVIEFSVARQLSAISKQRAALRENVALAESAREALKEAFKDISAGSDDGLIDFADLNAATAGARKALQDGDIKESLKLAKQGVDVVRQLRAQGDLSGLAAQGALKELQKIIDPASQQLEQDAEQGLFELQKVAEKLKDIEVGVNLESVKAAAKQASEIFASEFSNLDLSGVNLANLDSRDNIIKDLTGVPPENRLQRPDARVSEIGRVVLVVPDGKEVSVEGDADTLKEFSDALVSLLAEESAAAGG